MRAFALEALRAMVGVFLLPKFLVTLPSDEYVTSMATGGEWVRLNASGAAAACFAERPASDSRCRYLARSDCEAHACVWANPSRHMCVHDEDTAAEAVCEAASHSQCGLV